MQKFIAKTFFGLEEILAEEVRQIGGKNITILRRAVSFEGDDEVLYKANIYLRTAIKVLVFITGFKARKADELYNNAKKIQWSKYFSVDKTIAVESVVHSKFFNHTGFVYLKVKDAVADHFRMETGKRPNVKFPDPDVMIHVHIINNNCALYLDSSGMPLYKRGYRTGKPEAPLNECLAAGLVLLSGWNRKQVLIDPMCGSGTILIEAALIGNEIPPNINRTQFCFKNWFGYNDQLFDDIRTGCSEKKFTVPLLIYGADKSTVAVRNARENIERAGFASEISIRLCAIEDYPEPNVENGVIITNPPYDLRIKEQDINSLYQTVGNAFKNTFTGFTAWLFSGNKNAVKSIGLRHSRKTLLYNGQLECRLIQYTLYKGSKKNKDEEQG
ncbi:MAG: RNA methyltransferase [Marinilabiliales bacterium]|nr:MAG: RNA methyltransferase [Marinilabiliales bacterium]